MNEYSMAAFLHTSRGIMQLHLAIEGAILTEYKVTSVPWSCAVGMECRLSSQRCSLVLALSLVCGQLGSLSLVAAVWSHPTGITVVVLCGRPSWKTIEENVSRKLAFEVHLERCEGLIQQWRASLAERMAWARHGGLNLVEPEVCGTYTGKWISTTKGHLTGSFMVQILVKAAAIYKLNFIWGSTVVEW